jgi:2-polyprenyl-3-methyl-5-hydroxy-6-metoxy-1,4-benzoquinol methylase
MHSRPDHLEDLVRIEGSPYGLAVLEGRAAQFVICRRCGFVFQNPTLDDEELATLYQGEYRTYDPPDYYVKDQNRYAEILCNWLEKALPYDLPGRRVLDIGCGAGCFLAEFARRGWETIGIDGSVRWTAWGRERFGLDLRAGMFGAEGLPGERFSLVIFSHVIEHLPDPLPTLQAIRRCVAPGGMLFVGAPNILLPPTSRRLQDNFMAGPHVCLYSPRTIRHVLAKAGFRVAVQDNWLPRGLRVIASVSETPYRVEDYSFDDWEVINHLYAGLTPGCPAGRFARNLAGLLPRYWLMLEALAERQPGFAGRLRKREGTIVNLRMPTSSGSVPLLVRERGAPRTGALDIEEGDLVVSLGLEFGDHALSLLPDIEQRKAKLLIWEPDLSIIRAACLANDLMPLLRSPHVRLCGGGHVLMTSGLKQWFRRATRLVWWTDPGVHKTIHRAVYEPAMRKLRACAERIRAEATPPVSEEVMA